MGKQLYVGLNECTDSDRIATEKITSDSTAEIQKHLDGAIVSAWNSVRSSSKLPALTRVRWVWKLAGSYHLCRATSWLMVESAQCFTESGRESLAQWAKKKADEERERGQLALLEIESMGYDSEAVVEACCPPVAEALMDYFAQTMQVVDPIRCIGYVYTIERLGLVDKKEYSRAIEVLPLASTRNTRCSSATSIGIEVQQVKDAAKMLAGFTVEERTRIAIACYETALLCLSPANETNTSEEELDNVLQPLESHSRRWTNSPLQINCVT